MDAERRIFLASQREVWCLPDRADVLRCVFEKADLPASAPDALDVAFAVPERPVGIAVDVAEPPVEGAVRMGLRALFDAVPADDWATAAEAWVLAPLTPRNTWSAVVSVMSQSRSGCWWLRA